jgi:Protein of unknown function (DUF1566)
MLKIVRHYTVFQTAECLPPKWLARLGRFGATFAVVLTIWLALPAPASAMDGRYQVSHDGQEVTDTVTRLTWRRCLEGMAFASNGCRGTAASLNHEGTLQRAQAEATRAGQPWRLPNVKELSSLVSRANVNPAIDVDAFPRTPVPVFWTSSPYSGAAEYAWCVDFDSGYVYANYRSNSLLVRLVRASQ